jgi:hypothetical protein
VAVAVDDQHVDFSVGTNRLEPGVEDSIGVALVDETADDFE